MPTYFTGIKRARTTVQSVLAENMVEIDAIIECPADIMYLQTLYLCGMYWKYWSHFGCIVFCIDILFKHFKTSGPAGSSILIIAESTSPPVGMDIAGNYR